MEDEIDRLIDLVMSRDVEHVEAEVRPALQVLDVLERPGVQVVDADHAVAAGKQEVAQMRTKEAGAAGHKRSRHASGLRFGVGLTGEQVVSVRDELRPVLLPPRLPEPGSALLADPVEDQHSTTTVVLGPDALETHVSAGVFHAISTPAGAPFFPAPTKMAPDG